MRKPDLPYVGEPRLGDLLAFAYGNGFTFGIFAGYGWGTVQFYQLEEFNHTLSKETPPRAYKSYMGGGNVGQRVLPYNPAMLPPKQKTYYEEIRKHLDI